MKYTIKLSPGSASYNDEDFGSKGFTHSRRSGRQKLAREEVIQLQKKQISSFEKIASIVENILRKDSDGIPASKTNELLSELRDSEMKLPSPTSESCIIGNY